MPRCYCKTCHYPQTACICASVSPMDPATELVVLQHPSEVTHKKNTVRLLSLVLPQTRVYVGGIAADFTELRQYLATCGKPVYLIYPCESSLNASESELVAECVLLLLDGTWRKAFKLLQLNPWLLAYPALHLDVTCLSRYRIRKSSRSDSLSTLEAAAYMLSALDSDLDISPLLTVFDAMVEQQLKAMPQHVRGRYPTT